MRPLSCLRGLMSAARFAAALALVPSTAFAQTFSQSIDILEQRLSVDLTGPDPSIDIRATIKMVAANADLMIPTFAMPVQLAEVDGVPVTPVRDSTYPQYVLHLALGSMVPAGTDLDVHLLIRGTPSCSSLSISGLVACSWTPGREAVLPLGGPSRCFHLFNLFESDTFTGSATVRAPEGLEVVAGQGGATSVTGDGSGAKTWTFDFATPTESVPIYATDGATETSTTGFKVRGYFHDNPRARANMQKAVSLASRLIPFYGQLYGMPVPVDEVHILIVPPTFEFAGAGYLGNVLWADYVVGTHDYLVEQGVAHEFAHTWWGNLATGRSRDEAPFLAEAFAEYTTWRGLGEVHGDSTRTSGVRMNALWYMYARPPGVDVAILDPSVARSPAYVHAIYHKGSTVLRTLEEAVGTEPFTRALQRFVRRGYGGLSVQTFLVDLAQETGYDASDDVDQWMRRTGYPVLKAEGSLDESGATVQIASEGGFKVHVPLQFVFADGTATTDALELSGDRAMKRFSLPRRPVSIAIDPRWTFVRELKPATNGDVTLDGEIDASDLIEIALHRGAMATERRRDGSFDPFYDINGDRRVDDRDLEAAKSQAHAFGGN